MLCPGGPCSAREGQHRIQIHGLESRLRTGLADRRAQAAIGLGRGRQRGQSSEVDGLPLHTLVGGLRRASHQRAQPHGWRARQQLEHQLAAHQPGGAGDQGFNDRVGRVHRCWRASSRPTVSGDLSRSLPHVRSAYPAPAGTAPIHGDAGRRRRT